MSDYEQVQLRSVFEYATTYAVFQPSLVRQHLDLVVCGPAPSPPSENEPPWSNWLLFGPPLACPCGDEGEIALIWTWQRHRTEPKTIEKAL